MKILNQILSLAPTPLFLTGGIVSLLTPSVCSAGLWISEMTVMWFLMALAHASSWVIFWERRRYINQQLPDKQQ
jgi:hypothetical protein